MEEFNLKDFDKIYDEKIAPKLEQFEQQRKKTLLICKIIDILAIILSIAILYYNALNINLSILFIFLPIIIAFIGSNLIKNNFKILIKKDFYKNLFNSIGFQYTNIQEKILRKSESFIQKICQKSDIFTGYDNVIVDDIIKGQFNSLPFSAYDTHISYETSDGDSDNVSVTVFQGIVIQTSINKPLNCDILIKKDEFSNKEKVGDKERVKLESIEFEKMFEVYSNDQIEARYILTPSFMERLMNYTKTRNGKAVEVYLSNKISEEYNVFFFLHTNKDNFEVPLLQPITDKKIFYNILKELTDALDVISELKLEQNIGL